MLKKLVSFIHFRRYANLLIRRVGESSVEICCGTAICLRQISRLFICNEEVKVINFNVSKTSNKRKSTLAEMALANGRR